MLSVYTRHSQKCPHRDDIAWRRCRCPKWIQGTPSEDHDFVRTSAQTLTWEQAEAKARQLNGHGGFGEWTADVSRHPKDLLEILERHNSNARIDKSPN